MIAQLMGTKQVASRFAWLVICMSVMIHCTIVRGDEAAARERFLRDAPKAWAEAEAINQDVAVEVSMITYHHANDKEYTTRQETIVKSLGRMTLQQITEWPAEGNLPETLRLQSKLPNSRVDTVNDQRSFLLRREGDSPWVVGYVGSVDDDNTAKAIDRLGRKYIFWPWRIAMWSVPKMCSSAGFHLEQVDALQEGNDTLIKVSFSFNPQKTDEPNYIRRGWILFDPKKQWSIRRCAVHLESPNGDVAEMTVTNEYKNANDATPQKATLTLNNAARHESIKELIEFKKYKHEAVSASDFTMAAFGVEMPVADSVDKFGYVKKYYGKESPELRITDARGVGKNVKLADLHGKWILLDFWAPSCQPCIQQSLPALMKFYEDYATQRNRFEILAVCVSADKDGPKTVQELDRLLAPVIEKAWHGKSLPFPILLDGEAKTFEAYNIISVPSTVLIDPQGRVVKDGDAKMLAEKLKE